MTVVLSTENSLRDYWLDAPVVDVIDVLVQLAASARVNRSSMGARLLLTTQLKFRADWRHCLARIWAETQGTKHVHECLVWNLCWMAILNELTHLAYFPDRFGVLLKSGLSTNQKEIDVWSVLQPYCNDGWDWDDQRLRAAETLEMLGSEAAAKWIEIWLFDTNHKRSLLEWRKHRNTEWFATDPIALLKTLPWTLPNQQPLPQSEFMCRLMDGRSLTGPLMALICD